MNRFLWLDDAPVQSTAATPDPISVSPKEFTKKRFAEIDELLKLAEKNKDVNSAIQAQNIALEIEESSSNSASDKQKAQTLRKKANQIQKDIEFGDKLPDKGPTPSGDSIIKIVREPLPKQQVWIHDAFPGSVLPGKAYQYRMRVQIFNRLAGFPERLETPADAQVIFVAGPWSEPSDPITIEAPAHVFLTRGDDTKEEVTVELYKWYRAVWVTSRQKLKIGDSIDIEDRVDTPDPTNPKEVYAAKVPFRMDAMVVDIDFDRAARERKIERGGVRFLAPERTSAVVFVDSTGQLQERVEALDRTDATRSLLKSRVWKAPKGKK